MIFDAATDFWGLGGDGMEGASRVERKACSKTSFHTFLVTVMLRDCIMSDVDSPCTLLLFMAVCTVRTLPFFPGARFWAPSCGSMSIRKQRHTPSRRTIHLSVTQMPDQRHGLMDCAIRGDAHGIGATSSAALAATGFFAVMLVKTLSRRST